MDDAAAAAVLVGDLAAALDLAGGLAMDLDDFVADLAAALA